MQHAGKCPGRPCALAGRVPLTALMAPREVDQGGFSQIVAIVDGIAPRVDKFYPELDLDLNFRSGLGGPGA